MVASMLATSFSMNIHMHKTHGPYYPGCMQSVARRFALGSVILFGYPPLPAVGVGCRVNRPTASDGVLFLCDLVPVVGPLRGPTTG